MQFQVQYLSIKENKSVNYGIVDNFSVWIISVLRANGFWRSSCERLLNWLIPQETFRSYNSTTNLSFNSNQSINVIHFYPHICSTTLPMDLLS